MLPSYAPWWQKFIPWSLPQTKRLVLRSLRRQIERALVLVRKEFTQTGVRTLAVPLDSEVLRLLAPHEQKQLVEKLCLARSMRLALLSSEGRLELIVNGRQLLREDGLRHELMQVRLALKHRRAWRQDAFIPFMQPHALNHDDLQRLTAEVLGPSRASLPWTVNESGLQILRHHRPREILGVS